MCLREIQNRIADQNQNQRIQTDAIPKRLIPDPFPKRVGLQTVTKCCAAWIPCSGGRLASRSIREARGAVLMALGGRGRLRGRGEGCGAILGDPGRSEREISEPSPKRVPSEPFPKRLADSQPTNSVGWAVSHACDPRGFPDNSLSCGGFCFRNPSSATRFLPSVPSGCTSIFHSKSTRQRGKTFSSYVRLGAGNTGNYGILGI